MTSSSLVKVEGVSKVFGEGDDRHLVLSDLSIEIRLGEILAICGRSGVGKSTLLRLIAGLDKPSSGHITINGDLVTSPPRGSDMWSRTTPVLYFLG